MNDLISRREVSMILDKYRVPDSVYYEINKLPEFSAENKGEWQLGGYDDMYYVCSKCGFKASEYYAKPRFNFCPNCGLKMNREEPEEIIGIGNADKMGKLIDNLIKTMDGEPKEEKGIK